MKDGSGLLELAAASPAWEGDWSLSGGMTRISAAGALGVLSDITLSTTIGAATLSFTNEPSAYTRTFVFNPGTSKAAVFDTGIDATLSGTFTATSGGFLKRGEASLTLNGTIGQHEIEVDRMGGNVNSDPSGNVSLPANGDSPDVGGLGGLTILEGTLRLTGQGAGKTEFKATHHTMIGSTYNASCSPVLEVANCRFTQGSGGYHFEVGGTTPAATSAIAPTLRVLDGGHVAANGIKLANRGHTSGSVEVSPTLAVTNGTVEASYAYLMGTSGDSKIKAVIRAGADAVMRVTYNNSMLMGGILWQGDVDAEIADGAWFGLPNRLSNGFYLYQRSCGEMRFLRGGKMLAPKIISSRDAPTGVSTFVFDGGVLQFNASEESIVNGPDKRTIRLDGDGVEVVVGSGLSHLLEIPVNGAGALVKSGVGELVLGVGRTLTTSDAVTNDSGVLTANWTGGTRVAEGTLTVAAGAAREDLAVNVDEGAVLAISGSQTLGAVSGGGTVAGVVLEGGSAPSLSCTISIPWGEESPAYPTFENVALGSVTVDFNAPAGETYKTGDRIAVAKIGEGATTGNLRSWKTANAGSLVSADFSLEGDVVYAKMAVRGLYILLK
jgi:hypothetical protein